MTIRSTLFASLMLLSLAAPVRAEDNTSQLTGKTLITGDNVTVGDLFTNAGGSALHVLAPAPAIGDKLVLNSNDLSRVAKAFHLKWQEQASNGVTLERDATAIEQKDIIAALNASELKAQLSDHAELQLNNLADPVLVPGQGHTDLAVSNVNYDEQSKKFTAQLAITRDNAVLKQVALEGNVANMVVVPVLRFAMTHDTLITENDVAEIKLPENQLRGSTIFKKEDLIGMSARRTLVANQPLSQQDVIAPVLVKRNDLVTIIYKSGAIQLSSKARSLGNGARGDSIQFLNTTSKKAFEAKVTGPQTAEVNLDG